MTNKEFKPLDLNNYKPCFITRFGHHIDMALAMYRQYGFKESVRMNIGLVKFKIHKFRYKHCKRYRAKVNAKLDATGIAIIDMFVNNKGFTPKHIIDTMSDERKAEWRETAIKNINKIIEEHNVTDEDKIKELYNQWGIDYED